MKGIDYWTEEDKQGIKKDVQALLQEDLDKKVDKKEGYSLSQEDFTTLLKQKLEGLENYNDEEIREILQGSLKGVNYTASTGIMTFTKNDGSTIKIDLPLELLVESGMYDRINKQIVLTLANGNVINIPLSDLLDDLYTKEEVDKKLQEKDKVIETLEQRLEDLESELPDKEEEGSNINITDSAQARASIVPLGNTEQDTVTDNLFDNVWENGDIHYDTGALLTSDALIRNKNYQKVVPNILYKLSRLITTGYMYFRFYDKDFNYLGSQSTEGFVTTNKADNRMYIGEASMELTISNTNIAYMKCIDSSNNTSQIYTLITEVTPSINYPSPIKVVEGSFESYNKWQTPETQTREGVKLTKYADGSFDLKGTATADTSFNISVPIEELELGQTYTLYTNQSIALRRQIALYNGDTWVHTPINQSSGNTSKVFTGAIEDKGATVYRCFINVESGKTYDFTNVKIMLLKGEYTENNIPPYLPYGTIKNTYETKIQNKNYFDKDNTTIEIGTINTDGNFSVSNIRVRAYDVNLKEEKEYTISSSNKDLQVVPYFYDSNNKFISYSDGWKNMPYTFTMPKGASILKCLFKNSTDTITVNDITDLQIEDGNTATDYVEHQEQTKNLDFPEGIQLAKEDEIEFSYTEKNGYKAIDRDSVYHVAKNRLITSITKEGVVSVVQGFTISYSTDLDLVDTKMKSTHQKNTGKGTALSDEWKKYDGNCVAVLYPVDNPKAIYFNKKITTAQEAVDWWNENGIELIIPLLTPIRTKITDETFISQLEDLLNSSTYKGVTHITTSKEISQVAELIVKVDYKQSNSSRIDALEKAILSLGSNV